MQLCLFVSGYFPAAECHAIFQPYYDKKSPDKVWTNHALEHPKGLLCSCHKNKISLRAYYETDSEIKNAIQDNYSDVSKASEKIVFEKMDTSWFRQNIDQNHLMLHFTPPECKLFSKSRSKQ